MSGGGKLQVGGLMDSRAVFAISVAEPHGLVLQRGSAEQRGLFLAAAEVGGTPRAPSAGVLLGDDSERKDLPGGSLALDGSPSNPAQW